MKKILLTGGGTAGHALPNLAILPTLVECGFEIHYAGSKNGIERSLVEDFIPYYHIISTGKLRRYFNIKNFTDIFRTIKGVFDAFLVMVQIKPDIVFSKGGFVSVPVVIGARLRGVPVIIHESDMTPGLANKITQPFAKRICVSFPETLMHVKKSKAVLTGVPIRAELFNGDKGLGAKICRFDESEKPVAMIMGGSLGAKSINECIRAALPGLLNIYKIIHICGKGNLCGNNLTDYTQFEYANDEMPHLFALADIIVSRAGANTINELLALKKPNLLIPLPKESTSRGDQIQNAASFYNQGFSMVLEEKDMNSTSLINAMRELYNRRGDFTARMDEPGNYSNTGTKNIMGVINETLGQCI